MALFNLRKRASRLIFKLKMTAMRFGKRSHMLMSMYSFRIGLFFQEDILQGSTPCFQYIGSVQQALIGKIM